MENKLVNIAGILKDAPRGTKLWSSVCGICSLESADKNSIRVSYEETTEPDTAGFSIIFDQYGRCSKGGVCLLSPTEDSRTWENFYAQWRHKQFKPLQHVLVASYIFERSEWRLDTYSHSSKPLGLHITMSGFSYEDAKIIPYEGNENMLGSDADVK